MSQMSRSEIILTANIALMQKQAASASHMETPSKKLEEEATKENVGGAPASAGDQTNAANAATFEHKDHKELASGKGPSNNLPDNENSTPRQKVASLDDMIKTAAEQKGATHSKKLEEESKKEVVGGGNGNEVQSAQESAKAPDIKMASGSAGGDVNSDSVPRSKAMDKTASQSAVGIYRMLKAAIPHTA